MIYFRCTFYLQIQLDRFDGTATGGTATGGTATQRQAAQRAAAAWQPEPADRWNSSRWFICRTLKLLRNSDNVKLNNIFVLYKTSQFSVKVNCSSESPSCVPSEEVKRKAKTVYMHRRSLRYICVCKHFVSFVFLRCVCFAYLNGLESYVKELSDRACARATMQMRGSRAFEGPASIG